MTWLTVTEYVCHKSPRICSTCGKHFPSFPHSWLITGFVTSLTWRVSLVEQELLTLPEHLSSPRFLVGLCYLIFSFMCMFCWSLFVLLYFFFWPLCCLFFFDIRILITLLVSSNSSCQLCSSKCCFIFVMLYKNRDVCHNIMFVDPCCNGIKRYIDDHWYNSRNGYGTLPYIVCVDRRFGSWSNQIQKQNE